MKRTWPIAAGVLLLALVGFGAWKWATPSEKTVWQEVPVTRGDLTVRIDSTGTVQPENRLDIKAPIAGRMEQILVSEGQHVRRGQIIAWMSSTERAALLDAARAQGVDEVKRWEELYRATPVIAPINGTVILRSVETGQSFTNTDAIFTMADRLIVKASVDETDIAQVKVGQPAVIELDAYPGRKVEGKVTLVAFDSTTVSNVTTYVVEVLPHKVPDFMRSGMTANVLFDVDQRKNVLTLSSEAVIPGAKSAIVTVRTPQGKEEREVSLGVSDGSAVEVTDGLSDTDVVLVKQISNKAKATQGNMLFGGPPRGGGRKPKG